MAELRQGFDYHLAEVRPSYVQTTNGEKHDTWQAFCEACGWTGFDRATKGAAEEDAYLHDVNENDLDMTGAPGF